MTIISGFLHPGVRIVRKLTRYILVVRNQVMQKFSGRDAERKQHQQEAGQQMFYDRVSKQVFVTGLQIMVFFAYPHPVNQLLNKKQPGKPKFARCQIRDASRLPG